MWKNGKARTQLITFSRALHHNEEATWREMVSNHFGAKVVAQCSGALPASPCLNVLHYLSLISRRFGGLFRIAGLLLLLLLQQWWPWRMLKAGDHLKVRRRLPVASVGDAWVEGAMPPGLAGALKRQSRFLQDQSSVSLIFFNIFFY